MTVGQTPLFPMKLRQNLAHECCNHRLGAVGLVVTTKFLKRSVFCHPLEMGPKTQIRARDMSVRSQCLGPQSIGLDEGENLICRIRRAPHHHIIKSFAPPTQPSQPWHRQSNHLLFIFHTRACNLFHHPPQFGPNGVIYSHSAPPATATLCRVNTLFL